MPASYSGTAVRTTSFTLPSDGDNRDASSVNTPLQEIIDMIVWVDEFLHTERYGDGSDGDHTVSGTETLTGDKFYDNLTVPNGATLNTGNFRIYCRTSCTVDAGGKIHANASGQSAVASGSLLGGDDGGSAGGIGAGGGNSSIDNALGSAGGAGGNGSGGGAGGSSTANSPAASLGSIQSRPAATTGHFIGGDAVASMRGGAGGGGGGGGSSDAGAVGGGGGGTVYIAAFILTNNGDIEAKGDDGAAATGTGGGGGGGGGGCVFLVYDSKGGVGNETVTAGTGGGGASSGSNGTDGQVIEVTA